MLMTSNEAEERSVSNIEPVAEVASLSMPRQEVVGWGIWAGSQFVPETRSGGSCRIQYFLRYLATYVPDQAGMRRLRTRTQSALPKSVGR